MGTELLLSIILILLAAIGYFIKRILDKTDKISEDISDIKPKVEILWAMQFVSSKSPLTLNGMGASILSGSGVKEIVDEFAPQLVEEIKEKNPQNAYQVQERAREVMLNMKNKTEMLPQLEVGAFNTGTDVDTVLFVGSVYLRDLVLPKFNFKLEDIDDKKSPG